MNFSMESAKVNKRIVLSLVMFLFCTEFAAGQSQGGTERLRVTCTTTALSAVVQAVGGDRMEVQTIIPFGMCPGHFDLTPGEADKLRNADVILCHGFERFL